jgi:hypothetical protein
MNGGQFNEERLIAMNAFNPAGVIDPHVERPSSTTERLARYEAAEEIIGMMIALRAKELADEKRCCTLTRRR